MDINFQTLKHNIHNQGGIMRYRFLNKTIVSLSAVLVLLFAFVGCAHENEHQPSATQQRFDDIDLWVKMFEDPERDQWQRPAEVVKAMKLNAGDVVADIGAGTGYFTRRFAVAVGPVGRAIGLDIEQSMVTYMQEDAARLKLKNYEARVVRTDDPELAPMSVDVIFLCNTYHHIENRAAYFSKVFHSLKPDGRIVIVDFYKDSSIGPPRDHKMAKDIVVKEMSRAGYTQIASHTLLEHQYFLEFGR